MEKASCSWLKITAASRSMRAVVPSDLSWATGQLLYVGRKEHNHGSWISVLSQFGGAGQEVTAIYPISFEKLETPLPGKLDVFSKLHSIFNRMCLYEELKMLKLKLW